MKLDYKKTFLIGFGFFATSIAWSIYNSYVPLLLEPKLAGVAYGTTLLGFIMAIDNVFGVIFQPLFGFLSDRTKSRYGRRLPYIFIGIPLCAITFALVPTMAYSLGSLMATVIIFNFIMSTWRAPVVALMPDLTPAPLRSKANGVINMMGGVGSLIAFLIGGYVYKAAGYNGPFLLSSIVMVLALFVLFFFVKEPVAETLGANDTQKKEKEKIKLAKGETISLILILFAIFFWFAGYNAVETYFTLFATNSMGMEPGDATITLAFFSITFLAAAIPAGILGGKIGRKRTILIGLAGVTALFIVMFFVKNLMALRILLLLGGVFWAGVNINSLPMVVEMAGLSRIGTFTGFYYFFSFSAAIASPPLYGLIHDSLKSNSNYSMIFIYAAIAFAIAIGCIAFVKHGESVVPEQKLTTEEVMGMQED